MEILKTIIPIFAVIVFGAIAKKRRLISTDFFKPANRLAYYFAIPAMILKAVAESDFREQFNIYLLLGTILPLVIVFLSSWILFASLQIEKRTLGTLVESTFHGNVGYIGFAVVFYYLGPGGFAIAGILSGFMMILHNLFAVIVLQLSNGQPGKKGGSFSLVLKIMGNPIIVSALAGILLSLFQISLPEIVDRTLTILGNLALPLALIVIGASLSFQIQIKQVPLLLAACLFKLLIIPLLGLGLYSCFDISPSEFLPGLILLTSPVATVVYILASEMRGDQRFAVNVISLSTALSAITISLWLGILG